MWCDEIVVGTDPRFEDPTLHNLTEFSDRNEKLKLVVEEFDFDNKNPQGKIKQFLRQRCTGEWCLEVDADEIFDVSKAEKIKEVCDDLPYKVYAIDLKSYNFFNGNWINQDMPVNRTMLTRNLSEITHHLDDDTPNLSGRLGNNLVNQQGKKIDGGFIFPEYCIFHYGWYSIPRKWEMKQTLHYYEGALSGVYNNLKEYTKNLDDDDIDFWGLPAASPIEYYIPGVLSEMNKSNLKKFHGKHSEIMREWIRTERTVSWGGISEIVSGMGRKIRNTISGDV